MLRNSKPIPAHPNGQVPHAQGRAHRGGSTSGEKQASSYVVAVASFQWLVKSRRDASLLARRSACDNLQS